MTAERLRADSYDVTSFVAVADTVDDWRVEVERRRTLSESMVLAGIEPAGHEMTAVLILQSIDGEALDVIIADDPHHPTDSRVGDVGLYDLLCDARRSLDIAISAMEIKS